MARESVVTAFWVCVLVFISSVHGQLYHGEECTHRSRTGVCTRIMECQSALTEIRQGKRPTICTFEGSVPVVCCPTSQPQPTTTSTPLKSSGENPGDKAAKMCEEYGKAVWRYERAPTLLGDSKPVKVDQCYQSGKPFIIGGEAASPREFPHMALVGFGDEDDIAWWCGGSLISPRFVLTAGHCVHSRARGGARWVRVGDLNVAQNTDNAAPQQVAVVERIAHPDYKPPAPYNDIALLKLERDVVFTEFVRPACLHTHFNISDRNAIASGWGRTDWSTSKGSDDLMKVTLPIQPTSACNSAYKSFFNSARLSQGITEDSMICAGSMEGGKDTCKGDSGGPLQLRMTQPYCMYDVIGLTSFGKSVCGARDSPAVYTRVSHFVHWIEKIVWP